MKAKADFKKRITINVLIFLIVTIGIIYFIVMSTSEDIKEIKVKTENIRIDLEEKYVKGQSLRKLSESLKQIESQIPELDKIFIKKSEAIDFITSLEKIAEDTNVDQKINLSNIEKNEKEICNKTPLQLTTIGSFANQMKYLTKLESSNYYINIKSLEITQAPSETEGINNINMLIFSNTYWTED